MKSFAARFRVLGSAMLLSVGTIAVELDDFGMDQDFAAMDGIEDTQFEMPVVLTAARLRQSQLDTPASVTVIEADTIAALGFKDFEDIFRLVPGMMVGYHSDFGEKAPSVSYHGTNAPEHRRLQVLIDGRSVFKSGLARVDWVDIPLAIEDIARIEVIRGPNSAAYGANSYLGIINIMTKHPSDEKGTTVKVTSGSRNVQDSYLNISTSLESTDVRWTLGSKKKSGFDLLRDGSDNRDGVDSIYSTLRTVTPLTDDVSMEWQLGYKSGTKEQDQKLDDKVVEYLEPEDIDGEDRFIWVRFNHEINNYHTARVQAYSEQFERTTEWDACLLIGIAEPCGEFNKNLDERKTELEYQLTSIWDSNLRSVMGVRYRLDQFDSETYNDGYSENENYSVFTNIEYKYSDILTTNIGGMFEDDDLNGENFSPRYAFNFHIDSNHSVRLIYSEAIRSPDLYEKSGQQVLTLKGSSLTGAGGDPFVYGLGALDNKVRLATGLVKNETIYSHEISYFGLIPSIHAQMDLKIFYDDLNGLITQALDHDPAKPLSSDNKIVHKGIEGQFRWNLNPENMLLVGFSKLDTDDDFAGNNDNIDRESSLTYETSGSLAWISSITDKAKLGLAYYRADNGNLGRRPEGYDFERLDTTLSHEINLHGRYLLKLQGTIQYRLDDDPILYENNTYEDKEHYYLSAQLNF